MFACQQERAVMFVIKLDIPIIAHEKEVCIHCLNKVLGILLNSSAIAKIEISHMMLVVDHFLLSSLRIVVQCNTDSPSMMSVVLPNDCLRAQLP